MTADRGEPRAVGCPGYKSWWLIPCQSPGGPHCSTSCDVGEGPCGIFPRMYVWWDPLPAGSIVGVMNTGCIFMGMVPLKMAYRL